MTIAAAVVVAVAAVSVVVVSSFCESFDSESDPGSEVNTNVESSTTLLLVSGRVDRLSPVVNSILGSIRLDGIIGSRNGGTPDTITSKGRPKSFDMTVGNCGSGMGRTIVVDGSWVDSNLESLGDVVLEVVLVLVVVVVVSSALDGTWNSSLLLVTSSM